MSGTWHAYVWMRALEWDALPEKQHQFYTTSDDISQHRRLDVLCCCALCPGVGSEEPVGGWQGVTGSQGVGRAAGSVGNLS